MVLAVWLLCTRCVCSACENVSGICVFWKRKALLNHSYCLHYYHKIYRGLKMLRCNDSGVFRYMHCWLCIKGQLIWKWPDMADVVLSQPVLFITFIHLGKITGQVRGSPSKAELISTTFGSWDTSLKVPHFSFFHPYFSGNLNFEYLDSFNGFLLRLPHPSKLSRHLKT